MLEGRVAAQVRARGRGVGAAAGLQFGRDAAAPGPSVAPWRTAVVDECGRFRERLVWKVCRLVENEVWGDSERVFVEFLLRRIYVVYRESQIGNWMWSMESVEIIRMTGFGIVDYVRR